MIVITVVNYQSVSSLPVLAVALRGDKTLQRMSMNVKLSALSCTNLRDKQDEMHIKVKAAAFNAETISAVTCRVEMARLQAAILLSKSG